MPASVNTGAKQCKSYVRINAQTRIECVDGDIEVLSLSNLNHSQGARVITGMVLRFYIMK